MTHIQRLAAALRFLFTLLGVSLVFFLISDGVLGLIIGDRTSKEHTFDAVVALPPYDGMENAAGFLRDQITVNQRTKRFEPYFNFRVEPVTTGQVNVEARGIRRTVGDHHPGVPQVFMFGGSTMWGTGSPDRFTLASQLQRRLGEDWAVVNYGQPGYVWGEELNLLMHLLAEGKRPKVVIFYDGGNDARASAYSPSIPRDPLRMRELLSTMQHRADESGWLKILEDSNYQRLADALARRLSGTTPALAWDAKVKAEVGTHAQALVDWVYPAHIRQAKALAQAYGFEVYFFWQPYLLSMTRQGLPNARYEDNIVAHMSPVEIEAMKTVYHKVRAAFSNREHEGVFFLGDLFNEVNEPIYVDQIHVGPRGNDIVSERIYEAIWGKGRTEGAEHL